MRTQFLLAVVLISLWGFSGCATVTTRVADANAGEERVIQEVVVAASDDDAAGYLARARDGGVPEAQRYGAFLEAARLTAGDAFAGREPESTVYRAAIRGAVGILIERDFKAIDPVGGSVRVVNIDPTSAVTVAPAAVERLIPSDQIWVGGLGERAVVPGVGLPYVAWCPSGDPFLAGQPGVPPTGMAIPVTAVLSFEGGEARLQFVRTLVTDRVRLGGASRQLAADFTAPLAYLLSRGRNRSLDLAALIFTDRNIHGTGLFQLQPYDPEKIPVVFVHGLMSRPEAWAMAVNGLLRDKVVRDRYQFWFFLYPTGLPVWGTAALLRSEFDRFDRELEQVPKDKVLVGHSMGGLVCNLMVREGGARLWEQFSDVPFESIDLDPAARSALDEVVDFKPRPDVSSVLFLATPHRGSPLALRPVASMAASLVRLPFNPLRREFGRVLELLRDEDRVHFTAPANSLRFLRANSPLVTSALALPVRSGVTMHSVIGDRGRRGPIADSSDGVVPYWSSHLPEAVTETMVPSGHGVNEHPDGIEAIRRILLDRGGSQSAVRN